MERLFYKDVSECTDAGVYNSFIQDLPDDLQRLCEFVQNLLIHAYWLEKYDCQIDDAVKFSEMQTRYAKDILDLAMLKTQEPLDKKREPKQRVVSICRDFSLILCAILRAKGIPSRTRCGFASYLTADHYEDHWICEFWSASKSRWVMVDAQLDNVHLKILNIDFNPFDVPSSRFIYAGEAWELCRSGNVTPEKFGILNLNGLPFIKGNLIRDLFSLNKIELLGWDTGWGILPEYITPIQNNDEMALLDQLAILSKKSDFAKAKQAVESQQGIKFPINWCLSKSPSITDLYAKYQ
ncbi:MAG: hypothetical protein ACJAT7_002646 [Psychromonas sp.]|jgi:hypothetical protein|uniref:transglutaminase domain-containing protein n=1 Tax=Psychromonas sp. TaxID=1884585 RepID=UPI0039E3C8AF